MKENMDIFNRRRVATQIDYIPLLVYPKNSVDRQFRRLLDQYTTSLYRALLVIEISDCRFLANIQHYTSAEKRKRIEKCKRPTSPRIKKTKKKNILTTNLQG